MLKIRYSGFGIFVVYAPVLVLAIGAAVLMIYHNYPFALLIGLLITTCSIYYVGRTLNSTRKSGEKRVYHNHHTLNGRPMQQYSEFYVIGAIIAYIAWAVSLFHDGIWWAGLLVVVPVAAPVLWVLVVWIKLLLRGDEKKEQGKRTQKMENIQR